MSSSNRPPQSFNSLGELEAEIRAVERELDERLLIQSHLHQVRELSGEVLELIKGSNERTFPRQMTSDAGTGGGKTATTTPPASSYQSGPSTGRNCTCPCPIHNGGTMSYGTSSGPTGTSSGGYESRDPSSSYRTQPYSDSSNDPSSGSTVGQVCIGVQLESDSSSARSRNQQSTASSSYRTQPYSDNSNDPSSGSTVGQVRVGVQLESDSSSARSRNQQQSTASSSYRSQPYSGSSNDPSSGSTVGQVRVGVLLESDSSSARSRNQQQTSTSGSPYSQSQPQSQSYSSRSNRSNTDDNTHSNSTNTSYPSEFSYHSESTGTTVGRY